MNMTNNRPFISLIIPVYNEEKYIRSCIESLINQTYPKHLMEWLFIDGKSSDQTVNIISEYAKKYQIKILTNTKRTTPISLNLGVKKSQGKYIIRIDAHAIYPPEYVEECVKCLNKTNADNVGGWIETEADGYIGKSIAKVLSSQFGVGNSSFRTSKKSGYVDTVPFGAFKKQTFKKYGLFNEELPRSEDNDLNSRIINGGGKIYMSSKIHSIYYCRNSIRSLLKQALQNGNALFWTIKINPRAMRIRHFVPFVFLLSLLILPLFTIVNKLFAILILIELLLYLLLDIYYSFIVPERKYGVVTILLFFLFHITYGVGSLLSLIGIKVY